MKIYISLPISGRPFEEVKKQAEEARQFILNLGHTPVSPLEIYAGRNPTYADHLCYDLRAMIDCDAIVMLAGWKYSTGCNIEHNVAYYVSCAPQYFGKEKKFRVFLNLNELKTWHQGRN